MPIREVKVKNENGEEVHAVNEVGCVINFGRDKKVCHITFDPHASRVSRVHASVEWTPEGVIFIDKSQEGTIVNGKRLKKSNEKLKEGVNQIQIGGVSMSVVIEEEEDELEETVLDSPSRTINEDNDTEIIEPMKKTEEKRTQSKGVSAENFSDEEFDNLSNITSFRPTKPKANLKRKSNASIFDEMQPIGKRGPMTQKTMSGISEVEKRKSSRTRKADESFIFDSETPAKKKKTVLQTKNSLSTESSPEIKTSPTVKNDDEMESIVNQVAAIPSVSKESDQESLNNDNELHFDRGPAAPNETIKYANLIFHPPSFMKKDNTLIDPRVPNFKRFIPKNMRNDGRTSVASNRSNASYNTSIQMIDSRAMRNFND